MRRRKKGYRIPGDRTPPTTKIHGTADALSNPRAFYYLTPGQAYELEGADVLLLGTPAATLIADQAYDAQNRMVSPVALASKSVVIPSNPTRRQRREDDRFVDQPRHLIENFFNTLMQCRAIATRCDKTECDFLMAIRLAAAVLVD